jgi:hypothetical protein
LAGPSTTWSDGNGSWSVGSNWTSGTPNASTNACILDGTSTVTLNTTGNAGGLQVASGNLLDIYRGSLDSGQTINSGTIIVESGFSTGYLINNGTISGSPESVLGIGGGTNNGVISVALDSGFSTSGTFNNTGTIGVDASNVVTSGTFNNSGTVNFTAIYDPGNFSISALNNSGTMSVSLEFNSSSFDGGTLNNSGTMNLAQNCFMCPPPYDSSGSISIGTLNNSGTLNIAIYQGSGNGPLTIGTLNNTGVINNSGTFTNSGAVMISNTGLFTTSTNYTQTAGSTLVNGTLTATGGAIVNIQGGTLGGTGIINGNVLMAGTMMPGDAPGTLTIFGNYEQTGTGTFDELIGPLSHSFLDVSGNVELDSGSLLEITLLGGYDPLNQTLSIMDFGSLAGQFSNGSSFWDDNYLWDITYHQHEVDVTAVQAPEPSSLLLLLLGLAPLAFFAHRKMDKMRRLA